MNTQATEITNVPPPLLAEWLNNNEAVLIDVREDFEHAEERIVGAVLAPLSKFDPQALRNRFPGKRLVFHCRSGKRSAEAAERFRENGERAFSLAGGIEGWKSAGRAVVRPNTNRLPILRQVHLIAGALVASGVGLGWFVSPWFFIVPAFVGCGLMFAGATGWCGMALLLSYMPWNRVDASGATNEPTASCAVR